VADDIKIVVRKMSNDTTIYIVYINDSVALITKDRDTALRYQKGRK